MQTVWMDTHWMDPYWWDTCWRYVLVGYVLVGYVCDSCWCTPFEWIRLQWTRIGGIRLEWIRLEWICVGYVWCAGYVWDIGGDWWDTYYNLLHGYVLMGYVCVGYVWNGYVWDMCNVLDMCGICVVDTFEVDMCGICKMCWICVGYVWCEIRQQSSEEPCDETSFGKKNSFKNSHRARIVLPQRLIRHGCHGACITLNLLREMSKLIHHRLNPANIEISIVESSENCKQHSRIQFTDLVLSSCCCTASNAKLHHKQT